MSDRIDTPTFAVVGHPNKGKSSIVAALTRRDDVVVSPMPGTTRTHRTYTLEADGKTLLRLVDTPGFQRAREVLERLEAIRRNEGVSRQEAVVRFYRTFRHEARYADEIELLAPVVEEEAGIMYVVDGSKPYGEEFEAEMEILRWCARPSMAVINRIGKGDYVDAWREALSSYFNIVRTYNPVTARLQDHLRLLESMGHADERLLPVIRNVVRYFREDYRHKLRQSARIVTETVAHIVSHRESMRIASQKATEKEKAELLERYKQSVRKMEQKAKETLRTLWNHTHLSVRERTALSQEPFDLFSEESATLFGLSKRELLMAGAIGGAATGAGIDLLFVGHTLFAGGAIGAIAGAIGTYAAFDTFANMKIMGRKAGEYRLSIGPIKDRNFPYVVTGRLLFFASQLASLSHAYRDEVEMTPAEDFKERWLSGSTKRDCEAFFKALRDEKENEESMRRCEEDLYLVLESILDITR